MNRRLLFVPACRDGGLPGGDDFFLRRKLFCARRRTNAPALDRARFSARSMTVITRGESKNRSVLILGKAIDENPFEDANIPGSDVYSTTDPTAFL